MSEVRQEQGSDGKGEALGGKGEALDGKGEALDGYIHIQYTSYWLALVIRLH